MISDALASSDPLVWRDEQVEIANSDVYSHEILVHLQALEDNDDDVNHNPIQLSEDYLRKRRDASNLLVVKDDARAVVMLLGDPTTPLALNRAWVARGAQGSDNQAVLEQLRSFNEKMDRLMEAIEALKDERN